MLVKVLATSLQCLKVFIDKFRDPDPSVILQSPYGCNYHNRIGSQLTCLRLDVEEFFSARSLPKPASVIT